MKIRYRVGPFLENDIHHYLNKYTRPASGSFYNFGWGNLEDKMILNRPAADFSRETVLRYGDPQGSKTLIRDVIGFLCRFSNQKITPDNLMITNGATNALFLLGYYFRKFLGIRKVLIQNPTFDTALNIFRGQGYSFLPAEPNLEGIDSINPNRYDLAYVMFNYQNPTGFSFDKLTADKIKKSILKKHYLINDDAYSLFGKSGRIDLLRHRNFIYIGSFSKYLFPGIRMGYIVAEPAIINDLKTVQKYFNSHPNILSQTMLQGYFSSGKIYEEISHKRVALLDKRRVFENNLSDRVKSLIAPSDGGIYYWFRFSKGRDASRIFIELLKNGIFVIPGDIYFVKKPLYVAVRVCISAIAFKKVKKGAMLLDRILKKYV